MNQATLSTLMQTVVCEGCEEDGLRRWCCLDCESPSSAKGGRLGECIAKLCWGGCCGLVGKTTGLLDVLAWPKGWIGFTKFFFPSLDHSVADAGGVISARVGSSSVLFISSSPLLLLFFLALPRQPRIALTKCWGSLLTEASDRTRLENFMSLLQVQAQLLLLLSN